MTTSHTVEEEKTYDRFVTNNLSQMTTGQTTGGAAARGPLTSNIAGRFEPDARPTRAVPARTPKAHTN